MDREIVGAKPCDVPDGFFDCVSDVEKLHIQKHELVCVSQLLGKPQATVEEQLKPDLVEVNGIAELGNDRGRLVMGRHVERDDQSAGDIVRDVFADRH